MDMMDSSRRTDRASEKAREALEKYHYGQYSSEATLFSGISDELAEHLEPIGLVIDWIDGRDVNPSAGDFVRVLRALDGEIAVADVSTSGDIWHIFIDSDGLKEFSKCSHCGSWTPEPVPEDYTKDWFSRLMQGKRFGSIQLLHRSDEELPRAVQEAMEGDG